MSQDHSCRAAVARLIAHRVSPGQRPCSAETGGLLSGTEASAGAVLFRRRPSVGAGVGSICQQTMALEKPTHSHLRWFNRIDARYERKPTSLPTTSSTETRRWISSGPHSSLLFSLERSDSGSGYLQLFRKGAQRTGNAPQIVGPIASRRRRTGRLLPVCLPGNSSANATWSSYGHSNSPLSKS